MTDPYSVVGTFCYGDFDCSCHLHIEECDQDMNEIPETRLASKIGCAGSHIASIKHGMDRGHEGKSEEADIVGRDVYTNDTGREGKPED